MPSPCFSSGQIMVSFVLGAVVMGIAIIGIAVLKILEQLRDNKKQ